MNVSRLAPCGLLLVLMFSFFVVATPFASAIVCECTTGTRDEASCGACRDECVTAGGTMTSFGGVSGTVCDDTGATIVSEAVCQCADGSTAPISGATLTQCCTACSTTETSAESVQYNGASESCPTAPASGTSGTEDTGTPSRSRTPSSYGYNNPLGTTNVNTVIGRVIRAAVGLVGALFLAMFVWGGVLWMTSAGEPEKVKKAKQALMNAIIGMVIVALSYTIINLLFGVAGTLTGA